MCIIFSTLLRVYQKRVVCIYKKTRVTSKRNFKRDKRKNMCSVVSNSNNNGQSPIETPTETISYKVKRRLFQDEEERKINTALFTTATPTITTTTLKNDDTSLVNNGETLALLKGANSDAVLSMKSVNIAVYLFLCTVFKNVLYQNVSWLYSHFLFAL